jgi:hypothetical protein
MRCSISILQLPFPSLDYFPVPEYFSALEQWYRTAVASECTVPATGLWEVPPWIAWLQAALRAATRRLPRSPAVQIIDLSRTLFDVDAVMAGIAQFPETAVYCVSPLTQNVTLATRVADLLRRDGLSVVAGGPISGQLDRQHFTSVFHGRVEAAPDRFLVWFGSILQIAPSALGLSLDSLADHLDYSWAAPRYRIDTMYMRTFTHHGCPLACSFCADRLTGAAVVPAPLLEGDLRALSATFQSRTALYIGDLSFGISRESVRNLEIALADLRDQCGRTFRLIVQTNPSLVTSEFANVLHQLGVAVVEIGVESANADSVRRALKYRPSTAWLEEKFRILQDAALRVAGNLVVGLPWDGVDEYAETEDFVRKWRREVWFNVYGFVPYPSTPIFDQLVKDRKIADWDFSNWREGAPFVFHPYRIPAQLAYEGLIKILRAAIGGD